MAYLIKNCNAVIDGKIEKRNIAIDGSYIETQDRNKKYEAINGDGMLVIPGFIDTHIHGCGGCGTEDGRETSILRMSELLIQAGVTTFFPTLYTDLPENMLQGEKAIAEAITHANGAKIGGIHSEGPFISPGKIGAQNPLGRKDADLDVLENLIRSADGHLKAMTLAPELPGLEPVIRKAIDNGIVLLAGHSDATYEEAMHGYELGVRHATHLFNAMSGLVHRKPGLVGAVLMTEDMYTEIIGDGLHVHPAIIKYVIRTKGPDKVAIITDSLKPTMQKEGKLLANGVEVEMLNGLWVTKGNTDLIQGSALTMHKAFKNLISWGISIPDAVKVTSTTPAKIYNLNDIGEIKPGYRADLVMMDEKLEIRKVFADGEIRYVV